MTATADRIPLAKGDDHVYAENCSTVLHPSGLEIYYQPEPRLYKVRRASLDNLEATRWKKVPSVTTVLDVVAKGGLNWHGMRVGIAGLVELQQNGHDVVQHLWTENPDAIRKGNAKTLERLLTANSLCVNKVRDKAADRGTNVHDAMERWAVTGKLPDPDDYPPEEAGYVTGLRLFLEHSGFQPDAFEVMVGSYKHGFAGRYDLDGHITEPVKVIARALTTDGEPLKRGPKWTTLPAGTYTVDLKTSKGIYDTHFWQLEGYEICRLECGLEPMQHRAVLHVTAHGLYEFQPSKASAKDFLNVLAVYKSTEKMKELKW